MTATAGMENVLSPDGTLLSKVLRLRYQFSSQQLEALCEKEIREAKQRRGVDPDLPPTEDDIIDILESQGIEDLDTAAGFDHELGYVHGETEFLADGIFVKIRAGLSDNRRKSTAAHECGHVLTLRELYDSGDLRTPLRLFYNGAVSPRNLMERLANECMAALLMPERWLRQLIGEPPHDPEKRPASDSNHGQRLIREVSETFQCSSAAARIRLLRKAYLVANAQRSFRLRGRVKGTRPRTTELSSPQYLSKRPARRYESPVCVAPGASEQLFLF